MPNTWNPADKVSTLVLSNGNLTAAQNFFGNEGVRSVDSRSSGKYYWEYTFTVSGSAVGIADGATPIGNFGHNGNTAAAYVNFSGSIYVNSTTASAVLANFPTGSVACVAVDLTAHLIWFRNGAAGQWNNSGTANPATGTGGFSISFLGAAAAYGLMSGNNMSGSQITANFGDSAFTGTVPSGFASGFPGAAVTPTAGQYAVSVNVG